ncbi:MAG: hypothetical protein ABSA48_07815 [Terracidiphilus sp.]|jgi:hypothetical protein
MPIYDVVYLYKPIETEMETHTWTYYRVRGSVEDRGTVQVSRVRFPSFDDLTDECGLTDIIDTPGIVGRITPHIQTLLREQWQVDHSMSTLIGILEQ